MESHASHIARRLKRSCPRSSRRACVRRRRSTRIAAAVFIGLGAVTALLALAVGGVAWKLSQGPLVFDRVAERVSVALEQQFGNGFDVDVRNAQIEWVGTPILAVTGVTIRDPAGNVVVAAPQAEIGFDLGSLAAGQLVPRHIDFVGLAVALTIDPDGSVSVSAAGGDAPETPVPVQPTDTSFGPGTLLDVLGSRTGAFAVLERAGIRDGRLRVNDRRRGHAIVYDSLALSYTRQNEQQGRLALTATGPSGPWTASLAVEGAKGAPRTLRLDVDNLAVSDLLGIAEPGVIPVSTDMPVDATFSLMLDPDDAVSNAEGRITGGKAAVFFDDPDAEPLFVDEVKGEFGWDRERRSLVVNRLDVTAGESKLSLSGTVSPPAPAGDRWRMELAGSGATLAGEGPQDKPIAIDRINISAHVPIGFGGVEFDKVEVTGPAVHVVAAGSVGRVGAFEGLRLDITTGRMPVRNLLAFWPSAVVSDVRAYMVESISAGMVERFSYATTMPAEVLADAFAKKPIPDEAVQLDTTVSGGAMRPAPGLPLLQDIEAVGRVTGRTVSVTTRRATAIGPTNQTALLTNGRFEVADTSQRPATARVAFDAAAPAEAAISILRTEALRPFVPVPAEISGLKGHVDIKTGITFRMQPELKPGDVLVQLQGSAYALAMENVFGKERLEGGSLSILRDQSGLTLKGEGKVSGSPAQFDLHQATGATTADAVVSLTFDDAARSRRGIKLPR